MLNPVGWCTVHAHASVFPKSPLWVMKEVIDVETYWQPFSDLMTFFSFSGNIKFDGRGIDLMYSHYKDLQKQVIHTFTNIL